VNQWLDGGVPASKLLVGIPLYGRTYILADPETHGFGAPIISAGTAGPYTQEAGFLAYYEVFPSPTETDLLIISCSNTQIKRQSFKFGIYNLCNCPL
jgi:GH18 family chitinase